MLMTNDDFMFSEVNVIDLATDFL